MLIWLTFAAVVMDDRQRDCGPRLRRNVFAFVPPEGNTVWQFAELARVRKQTMAQAVEQLERMGYVERRPNPRDRRLRLVFLTERGDP